MDNEPSEQLLNAIRTAKLSQAEATNRDSIHTEAVVALEAAVAAEERTKDEAAEAHRIALEHAHTAVDALRRELGV